MTSTVEHEIVHVDGGTDCASSGTDGWAFVAPPALGSIAPTSPPTFSVVMPAFNVAPYIGAALASALDQCAPALEVIVVDDGSTDALDEAVAPFRKQITLLRHDHGGEAAAKNRGIEAATGDFVAFFDGDDVQAPRRLEAMGALAALRPDLDILTTRCSLVRNGREIAVYPPDDWFPSGDQVRGMFEHDFLPSPAIRRAALRRVGGLDETLPVSPDTDCAIRLLLGGSLAGQVDASLFSYVRRPGQQTEDQVRAFAAEQQIFARYLEHPAVDGDRRAALLERLRTSQLHHLRAAVQESDPSSRAIARAVALDAQHATWTRCKALLAMIWPGAASRIAR